MSRGISYITQRSIENNRREKLALEALEALRALHKKVIPNADRERTKRIIENHTEGNKDIVKVISHIMVEGFKEKYLEEFIDYYHQRRNNTIALPSYKIPDDYEPEYEIQYNEIPLEIPKNHRNNFFGDYTKTFSKNDHRLYEEASFAQQDRKYQKAHQLFGELLERHEGFVRVKYNRIITKLAYYSGDLYHEVMLYVNNYDVPKPKLKGNEKKRIENAQDIKNLLKEFKKLKKQFPKYEMRKRNRGLQTSLSKIAKYIEEKALIRIGKKYK